MPKKINKTEDSHIRYDQELRQQIDQWRADHPNKDSKVPLEDSRNISKFFIEAAIEKLVREGYRNE